MVAEAVEEPLEATTETLRSGPRGRAPRSAMPSASVTWGGLVAGPREAVTVAPETGPPVLRLTTKACRLPEPFLSRRPRSAR